MAISNSYPTATPKSSDLLLGTQVYDQEDPSSPTENTTKNFTAGNVASLAFNYGKYVASFTQETTNDPAVKELENTTGLTFTWTRTSEGVYAITPSSSLTISKVWIQLTGGKPNGTILELGDVLTGSINILNMLTDGSQTNVDSIEKGFIEIRIYS